MIVVPEHTMQKGRRESKVKGMVKKNAYREAFYMPGVTLCHVLSLHIRKLQ